MSTIKDVALQAGVTIGTVSNYLNGKAVRSDNQARIEAAITLTGYRLDPSAQTLKTGKSKMIGVVVPDITSAYSGLLVKHLERNFQDQGYHTLICDTWGQPDVQRQKVETLMRRRVDGLVLYPAGGSLQSLEDVLPADFPLVVVDTGIEDRVCDQVLTDNARGIFLAVEHLVNQGHRRIGFINGGPHYYTARKRLEGYLQGLEAFGLASEPELICNQSYRRDYGYAMAAFLCESTSPPTAIIASNYELATGVWQYASEQKLSIPHDLALVGFDDVEWFTLFRPHLSVVAQPLDTIAQVTSTLLSRRMAGDQADFPSFSLISPQLLVRQSS